MSQALKCRKSKNSQYTLQGVWGILLPQTLLPALGLLPQTLLPALGIVHAPARHYGSAER